MAEGFKVWLQGGPGADIRVTVSPEPPDVIVLWPDTREAVSYVRVREVEQFDRERIYYPMQQVVVDGA